MDKFKKLIEEQRIFIVIGIIIVYFFFGSGDSENGEKVKQYHINGNTKNDIYYKNKDFELHATSSGYDVYNKGLLLGTIEGEKDINDFVKFLKTDGSYTLQKSSNQIKSGNNVGILIDNTYSEWNHIVDESLPEKRFDSVLTHIRNNNYITGGTSGKIGWLFSNEYGTPKARMNNESYSFEINPRKNELNTIYLTGIQGEKDLEYIKKYNKLIINKNVTLSINDNCKYISEDGKSFVCRDKEDFVKEIKNIYEKEYNTGDTHKGTNLLDYLYTKGFYDIKDIYVFSDGEFQISNDTSKVYLSNLNGDYNLKNTLEFNIQSYNDNGSFYKEYRKKIAKILHENLTKCVNNSNIKFVGLTSDSSPFKDFTKEIYEILFDGCNIDLNFNF